MKTLKFLSDESTKQFLIDCADEVLRNDGWDARQAFLDEFAPELDMTMIFAQARVRLHHDDVYLQNELALSEMLGSIQRLTWGDMVAKAAFISDLLHTSLKRYTHGRPQALELIPQATQVGYSLRKCLMKEKTLLFRRHRTLVVELLQLVIAEVKALIAARSFSEAIHLVNDDEMVRDCMREEEIALGERESNERSNTRLSLSLITLLSLQGHASDNVEWQHKAIDSFCLAWKKLLIFESAGKSINCPVTVSYSNKSYTRHRFFSGNFLTVNLANLLNCLVQAVHFPAVWAISMQVIFTSVTQLAELNRAPDNHTMESSILGEAVPVLAMTAVLTRLRRIDVEIPRRSVHTSSTLSVLVLERQDERGQRSRHLSHDLVAFK